MNVATFWRRFNAATIVVAVAVWVVAVPAGWIDDIRFISHVTMATAVQTAISMYMGSRAEQKAEDSGSG